MNKEKLTLKSLLLSNKLHLSQLTKKRTAKAVLFFKLREHKLFKKQFT